MEQQPKQTAPALKIVLGADDEDDGEEDRRGNVANRSTGGAISPSGLVNVKHRRNPSMTSSNMMNDGEKKGEDDAKIGQNGDNDDDEDDDDDDMDMDDEHKAETIRLRPYDWRPTSPLTTTGAAPAVPDESSSIMIADEFPRVSSQVPLSPKTPYSFGYELAIENEYEGDTFDADLDDDDPEEEDNQIKHRRSPYPPAKRVSKSKAAKLKDRGTWQGRFDFILSLIGYSVGLGNVWRFPYLVYSNGGGAFLIPFIVMMLVVGFPLMFMELAFGQYASLSPVVIFKRFSPLFAGLGYGMIAVSGVVMLYYNMIIAWTLYYMYASLRAELPWSRCDPAWSSPQCYSYKEKDDCLDRWGENATYINRTCYDPITTQRLNLTHDMMINTDEKKAPADEYFNNYVLGNIETLDQTGNIQYHLLISLLVAWILVFLCLSKGVQSSGKVVYFTALFPYLVLVILFIRGITLPGAMQGIMFYVKPDFSHLFAAHVWGDAAVQVFFALSPAWGGLITLASYNKFTNNCYRDSIIVLFANAGTSIFSGFVVFSIIGYLAHEMDVAVDQVIDQGVGLAFMVYPEVVVRLPISPFWSFLFFFMLITLGLDSQFALLETVQTAVLDLFPSLRDHKIVILMLVSTVGYAGGIIFTTQSGVLWLGLFDHYAANFSVSIIAITECLLIGWYYGTERFIRDIEKMIGQRSDSWKHTWTIIWKYITPLTLLFILIFNWIKHEPPKSGDYIYPDWANIFGWILAFIPTIIILATMLHTYCTFDRAQNKTVCQKINTLMQPSENWGPTHKNIEKLQRRKSSRFLEQQQQQQQQQSKPNSQGIDTKAPGTVQTSDQQSTNTTKIDQTNQQAQHNGSIIRNGRGGVDTRPILKQTMSDPLSNKQKPSSKNGKVAPQSSLQQKSFDNPSFEVRFDMEPEFNLPL